jgi:hypothetical protein
MYGVSAPADAAHLLFLGILAVPQTCMRLNLRHLKRHLKLRRHLKLQAEVRAQLQIQLTSTETAFGTSEPKALGVEHVGDVEEEALKRTQVIQRQRFIGDVEEALKRTQVIQRLPTDMLSIS